jgi:hypothetical protein
MTGPIVPSKDRVHDPERAAFNANSAAGSAAFATNIGTTKPRTD